MFFKSVKAEIKFAILFIFSLINCNLTHAGVIVNGTRFIYHENDRSGVTLSIFNTDSNSFLIQSKIHLDAESDITSGSSSVEPGRIPFVITPPLFSLGGHKESILKIIYTGQKLPADRESLYRISIAAIPAGKPEENSLQVAVRSRFKLFYRPEALKGNPSTSYQKLEWSRVGSSLKVTNATPFFITLFQFSVNGKIVKDPGMIPPFSSETKTWCPEQGDCYLRWKSLNDFGGVMPEWNLSSTNKQSLGTPVSF